MHTTHMQAFVPKTQKEKELIFSHILYAPCASLPSYLNCVSDVTLHSVSEDFTETHTQPSQIFNFGRIDRKKISLSQCSLRRVGSNIKTRKRG